MNLITLLSSRLEKSIFISLSILAIIFSLLNNLFLTVHFPFEVNILLFILFFFISDCKILEFVSFPVLPIK